MRAEPMFDDRDDGAVPSPEGFGVPARVPHPMPIREIEIWTPLALFEAMVRLALAFLSVPARGACE